MRILCVTGYYKPAYVYGGPVHSISGLCEGLAEAGAEVTVFTTDADGVGRHLDVPLGVPVNAGGVNVHYFKALWPMARLWPFYSSALGRACRASAAEYDAVYLVGSWAFTTWAGAHAAWDAGVPYVLSPRGSFMNWSMSQKPLKKRAYLAVFERRLNNRAAALHLTTSLEERQLRRWRFKPDRFIIPNGIDLKKFVNLPERGGLRRKLGISRNEAMSLFVGRLHKEKRIDLMIDAFAAGGTDLLGTHFVIAGPDEDGSGKLAEERVKKLGLSGRVHFLGLQSGPDLMQAYADADLLLLLSTGESFGMAAVEAMAAGLPVILSNGVGLCEEVLRAEAGFVVSPNLKDISSVWRQLIRDSEARQRMAQNGQRLVRERFSLESVSKQMIDLFNSLA